MFLQISEWKGTVCTTAAYLGSACVVGTTPISLYNALPHGMGRLLEYDFPGSKYMPSFDVGLFCEMALSHTWLPFRTSIFTMSPFFTPGMLCTFLPSILTTYASTHPPKSLWSTRIVVVFLVSGKSA
eukprot:4679396-Amphidinium_carterae.1